MKHIIVFWFHISQHFSAFRFVLVWNVIWSHPWCNKVHLISRPYVCTFLFPSVISYTREICSIQSALDSEKPSGSCLQKHRKFSVSDNRYPSNHPFVCLSVRPFVFSLSVCLSVYIHLYNENNHMMWINGAESNGRIAHNLGILLMNSNCFAIFFSRILVVYSDLYYILAQRNGSVIFDSLAQRKGTVLSFYIMIILKFKNECVRKVFYVNVKLRFHDQGFQ